MVHRLVGHAIVSDDDRIADAEGAFPQALRNEADWAQFQSALDAAAVTLLGRLSHEAAPNVRQRRRLVASRRVRGLEERADAWWWDPGAMPLERVLGALVPEGGTVAVPGGQSVFDLVGAARFDEFHLARAHGVQLPGGRGLFAACERGVAAADVLAGGGLVADPAALIDPAANVSLTIWRRSPPRR